ncbi:unnamed protein product, partial [Protopolystoma xenopodis]
MLLFCLKRANLLCCRQVKIWFQNRRYKVKRQAQDKSLEQAAALQHTLRHCSLAPMLLCDECHLPGGPGGLVGDAVLGRREHPNGLAIAAGGSGGGG